MKKIVCIICVATLLFTACLYPASAEGKGDAQIEAPMETGPIPVAYTHDFDAYSNVVGTLNADGTKTAYFFATSEDVVDQAEAAIGLPMPSEFRPALDTQGRIIGTAADVESACVGARFPNYQMGNLSFLCVGNLSSWSYCRSFLKFDISALTNTGISHHEVLSANLHLFLSNTFQGSMAVIEAYLAKGLWNESTITWNTAPDYYNGECLCAMNLAKINPDDPVNQYCMYITKAVMSWMQGMANYGIVLKEMNDQYDNQFYSDDYYASNKRPYLTVNYTTDLVEQSQGIESGEKYYLVNRATNKCLTAIVASQNANVYLSPGATYYPDLQQWKITRLSYNRFILTPGDSNYRLKNSYSGFGGNVKLGDSTTSNDQTWLISRNWNGTYRIYSAYGSYGSLQAVLDDPDNNAVQDAYTCDFSFNDEWTLEKVNKGQADLFSFLIPLDINTTYGMNDMRALAAGAGYSATVLQNTSASIGYSSLLADDLFLYNGHGEPGKLDFFTAPNVYTTLSATTAGDYTIAGLSENSLAKLRLSLLSSCNTGADLGGDNMTGRQYYLGAHNVISNYYMINSNACDSWFSYFLTTASLFRSVGEAKRIADHVVYGEAAWIATNFINNEDYYGRANVRHDLGDDFLHPLCNMAYQAQKQVDFQYNELPQYSSTWYNGSDVSDISFASIIATLPADYRGHMSDIYMDDDGGIYHYLEGSSSLVSYEPYTGNLQLGETIVSPTAAAAIVTNYMTHYPPLATIMSNMTCTSSSPYSKNYNISYYSSATGERINFNFQADTNGNVYLIDFYYCDLQ